MCGRIFCNDCVSSWTALAGSKKFVRVCGSCNDLLGSLKDGPLSIEASTINTEMDEVLAPPDEMVQSNGPASAVLRRQEEALAAPAAAIAAAAAAASTGSLDS